MPELDPNFTVIQGYPSSCTDEQLEQQLKMIQDLLAKHGYNINTVMQVSPLLHAGLFEQQKRLAKQNSVVLANTESQLSKVATLTETSLQAAEQAGTAARKATWLSYGVALASIAISIWIAYGDSQARDRWEQNQLKLLQNQVTAAKEWEEKQLALLKHLKDTSVEGLRLLKASSKKSESPTHPKKG